MPLLGLLGFLGCWLKRWGDRYCLVELSGVVLNFLLLMDLHLDGRGVWLGLFVLYLNLYESLLMGMCWRLLLLFILNLFFLNLDVALEEILVLFHLHIVDGAFY